MPSPIAHLAAGYTVYKLTVNRATIAVDGPPFRQLMVVLFSTMAPDADGIVGLLAGDFGRFHNQLSHTMVAGVLYATFVGIGLSWWTSSRLRPWFMSAWIGYTVHVVMDYFTWGRGVYLLWPIVAERMQPPFLLFYGLRWSEQAASWHHLITLLTEGAFAILILYAGSALRTRPTLDT